MGLAALEHVWRSRWTVLGVAVLAGLLGLLISQLMPVRYEATGEMLISDPRDAGVFGDVAPRIADPARYVRNEAQRVTSSAVATRASVLLDGAVEPAEVRERVHATPSTDLDLIAVTATGPTAQEAADVANAVMEAYQDEVRERVAEQAEESIEELRSAQVELEARVDAAEDVLAGSPGNEVAQSERDAAVAQLLANQQLIERITVDVALYGSGVEMVEAAVPPASPTAPRTLMNTVLATLLGFGAAAGAVVWRAQVQQRVDRRHEPATVLDVPLLAAIPDLSDFAGDKMYPTVSRPSSPEAEAFRFAVAAIEPALDTGVASIVVTSAQPGDGKTTVALNLGVVLAQEVRSVILVDTDVRMGILSRVTAPSPRGDATDTRRGLTDLTDWQTGTESALHAWAPTAELRLRVAPTGRREVDPSTFFRSADYRTALHRLRAVSDLVLIDAPPLLRVSDASAIAGSADAIILVIDRGTPLHVLAELQERLTFVGTPVLGYVFNRAVDKRTAYGYGYGSAYGHPSAPGRLPSDRSSAQAASARAVTAPGRPDPWFLDEGLGDDHRGQSG